MLDLKAISEKYLKANDVIDDILGSASESEKKIRDIYEGRFVLELLQNARDAIVQAGNKSKGRIKFLIKDRVLWVGNDGEEFRAEGVKGIVYIGSSDKVDEGLIGHKGIGFKSILEITSYPEIITNDGTLYFNKTEAASILNKDEEFLPLFFFPLYKKTNIKNLGVDFDGFTTVFKFPLKEGITEEYIIGKFNEISPQDLVFFGGIKKLNLGAAEFILNTADDNLEIACDEFNHKYKIYNDDFVLSDKDFNSLSANERDLFKSDRNVELRFLIPIRADGSFKYTENNNLYLYYKLEAISGLSFLLHSFFSVSPDRKGLLKSSELNRIIFARIGRYVPQFVKELRKVFNPTQVLEILAFDEPRNSDLQELFPILKQELSKISLVYHERSEKPTFYSSEQILLASKSKLAVFDRGYIADTPIVEITNARVSTWLSSKLSYKILTNALLKDHCERESQIQVESGSVSARVTFFQKFYNHVAANKIQLNSKKILYTPHGLKNGNESTVFYTGSEDERVTHPLFADDLGFLENGIKLDTFEGTHKYIGVRRYREEAVVRSALKAFEKCEDNENKKLELIKFLKRQAISTDSCDMIFANEHFELPLIAKNKWGRPGSFPLYLHEENRAWTLVNPENVVNTKQLASNTEDTESWNIFLGRIGVWEIPALYISEESVQIDWPSKVSTGFSENIFNTWSAYSNNWERINKLASVKKPGSFGDSSICKFIREKNWIELAGKEYCPSNVVALENDEFHLSEYNIIKKYLPVINVGDASKAYVQNLWMIPIRHMDQYDSSLLLALIYETYNNAIPVDKQSFVNFFNKILTQIHDDLRSLEGNKATQKSIISRLQKERFLTRNLISNRLTWTVGSETIHNNDNALFESLSKEALKLLSFQSVFTKRSKTDWGRYAGMVGSSLTSLLNIIPPEDSNNTTTLKKLWGYPSYVLALLESQLDRRLTDEEIKTIGDFKISVNTNLSYNIELGDPEDLQSIQIDIQYYVCDSYDGPLAYIERDRISNGSADPNVAARLTSELIPKLLKEVNVSSLDLLLLTTLKETNRAGLNELLRLRDVDEARVQELIDILEEDLILEEYAEKEESDTDKPLSKKIEKKYSQVKWKKTQTVIEEVEIEGTLDELRSQVQNDSTSYGSVSFANVNSEEALNENDTNGTNMILGRSQTTSTKRSRKVTGYLAEELVCEKLEQNALDLLSELNVEQNTFKVDWFNRKLKEEDVEYKDNSIGKGCDIEINPHQLCIEVKGSSTKGAPIYITINEYKLMKKKGENYFIVRVENLYNVEGPVITVYQDPYALLLSGKITLLEGKLKL